MSDTEYSESEYERGSDRSERSMSESESDGDRSSRTSGEYSYSDEESRSDISTGTAGVKLKGVSSGSDNPKSDVKIIEEENSTSSSNSSTSTLGNFFKKIFTNYKPNKKNYLTYLVIIVGLVLLFSLFFSFLSLLVTINNGVSISASKSLSLTTGKHFITWSNKTHVFGNNIHLNQYGNKLWGCYVTDNDGEQCFMFDMNNANAAASESVRVYEKNEQSFYERFVVNNVN